MASSKTNEAPKKADHNIWTADLLEKNDDQLKADAAWNAIKSKHNSFLASDKVVDATRDALLERKHAVTVVNSPEEALKLLTTDKFLPNKASVAFGGSVTLEQIGFIDAVKTRTDLYNYRAEAMALMAKGDYPASGALRLEGTQKADFFFSSVSALTEKGDIVVADASGTRTHAMIAGAKNVVLIVSANKIVPNLAAAIDRLENYIVPLEGAHMRALYKMPGTNLVNLVTIRNAGMKPGRIHVILIKGHSLGY